MRLTPAQIGVHLICGRKMHARQWEAATIDQRIAEGRTRLAELAGMDFQFDLEKWHEHFVESREGGYTWRSREALPKVMRLALASSKWRATVGRLTGEEPPD